MNIPDVSLLAEGASSIVSKFNIVTPMSWVVWLFIGLITFFVLVSVVQKVMVLVVVFFAEYGMAITLQYLYLPSIVSQEALTSLSKLVYFPPMYFDQAILHILTKADTSLILTCVIGLGVFWFYLVWILRNKTGMMSVVWATLLLVFMTLGAGGLRSFIHTLGFWNEIFIYLIILLIIGGAVVLGKGGGNKWQRAKVVAAPKE